MTPRLTGYEMLWSVWQSLAWGQSSPSPTSHLLSWVRGDQTAGHSLARTLAGAAGALSSYLVMSLLWELELSMVHQHRQAEYQYSHFCPTM